MTINDYFGAAQRSLNRVCYQYYFKSAALKAVVPYLHESKTAQSKISYRVCLLRIDADKNNSSVLQHVTLPGDDTVTQL